MTERNRASMIGMALLIGITAVGCHSPTTAPEEETPIPTTPGFTIALKHGSAQTVVPGEVLELDLLVQRDEGFEGAVELSASDAPGIVVIFRPAIVLHRDDSDLLVVAEQASQRRTHQIEFSARSEGVPVQTTTLSLTVVDSK